jgi:tetratricopeptide (TPR) repeat protein
VVAGRIGEHAEELAKLCGCLPLALRNAAYALKEKPNISVSRYMKRLGDARKRLELVEASFISSYELLTPELQSLWCLLSIFPADFDLAGAVAIWEMEKEPAEEALGELVKWSLVDFMPYSISEGGRYRLHDLARVFAASLNAAACDFAQQRHAEHYKNMLSLADEIFTQGKEHFLEGLQLFDQEKANILAGQSWAANNMDINTSAIGLCKAYSNAGGYVLDLRLHPKQKIDWLKAGLQASRQSKDNAMESFHLGNLGLAYSDMDETGKAIEYYEQALKIAREIGDQRAEGNHLGNFGLAYFDLSEIGKAIEYFEQAVKIDRENGNLRGEGNRLGNLGLAYSDLGEIGKAIEYYEQALKIDREIGDLGSEGAHLFNMSLSLNNLGQRAKAVDLAKTALKIYEQIESPYAETVRKALVEWKS